MICHILQDSKDANEGFYSSRMEQSINMKKIISLVSAICVFLIGIAMIIVAFTGAELPKPLWLLFAVCNLVNAFLIITNYKKKD